MKTVYVAIMGFGTVGGGAYEILKTNHDKIAAAYDVDIRVKKVLDRDEKKLREKVEPGQVCLNLEEILADSEISIVIEVMGGVEPAKTFIEKCMKAGKSVVTANKELISKHWGEIEAVAKANGVGFYFEASCVGGVPIIRTLKESMQGDNIRMITGIVNGTTNYILTKMTDEGMSYDDALKKAQELGYAEANPTADVEGFDAMYTLKLLAIGKREGNTVEVRVHPTFVRNTHPLAAVSGAFNAVFLNGDFVDDVMLYGRGAGARPTGSAIVSDAVYCATREKHEYSDFDNNGRVADGITIADDFMGKYYVALTALDTAGALSRIADVLGKNGVSIASVSQSGSGEGTVPIIIMTHSASENAVMKSVATLGKLDCVKSVDSLIRVID